MSSPPLSCPYCNAILTEIDLRSSTRRVLCPRCGETFPLPTGIIRDGAAVPPFPQGPGFDSATKSSKLSNRALAFSILAFMGLLAAGFFWYAWETQEIRREHDSNLPKSQSITIPIGIAVACNVYIVALIFAMVRPQNRPGAVRLTILLAGITAIVVTMAMLRVHIRVSSDPSAAEDIFVPSVVRSYRPAELPGLGYLPDDTNVIAAANICELMEAPAGREFLTGNAGFWNWQRLQDWTGISLNEVDHVIVGLKVDNNLLPRLIVVVETNRPLAVAQVKGNLRASKLPDPEAYLFPSDRVLILGLTKKDLERVSVQRSEGVGHLALPLQKALKERIPRGASVWAAGHADDWRKTLALAYFAGLPKEDREVVQRIQTFAIGFRIQDGPTVGAALQCADELSAKAVEQWLRQQKPDKMNETKISQKDDWVSFQAKVADISPLVNRMKGANLKPQ